MFRFDQYTLKYDRYIVVLTKRAANENLTVNNATENFLPSFHCFLLRSRGFKCNFIDFFTRELVSVLLELFLGSVAVFVWSGELCRLLLLEVLVPRRFLMLSSSFRVQRLLKLKCKDY